MVCVWDGTNPVALTIRKFVRSDVQGRVHCCTDVSDLNHFHVLPLQHQRVASTGTLPAVPAPASPQVPSMRMCCEADDEVGNHSVSVKGYVGLMTVNQVKQVWQQDKKDDKA